MIRELICYKCTCSKCSHKWTTKTHELPRICSKCKTPHWNDDYVAPEPETPSERTETPAIAISAPDAPQKETISNLQMMIDAMEGGAPAPIEPSISVETGWIEMPTTRENGEVLYWHRKPKGQPVCYKREQDWDVFA